MHSYNVTTSGYDTLIMVNIRYSNLNDGYDALVDRLSALGVNGNITQLEGTTSSNSYRWGYKVGNRITRVVINSGSVVTFAVTLNAADVPLEEVIVETYVDDDGEVHTVSETESLATKFVKNVPHASCSTFKTKGVSRMDVEVGLV